MLERSRRSLIVGCTHRKLLLNRLLVLALVTAGMPIRLGAFFASQASADDHMRNAKAALQRDDFQVARQELLTVLKLNPKMAEALRMLGYADLRVGNAQQAIEDYKAAIQIEPASVAGHYNLGILYLHRNEVENARRELAHAIQLRPDDASAAYNLGVVLIELKQAAEALKYLRRAEKLQPGRPDVAYQILRGELAANRDGEERDVERFRQTFRGDAEWLSASGKLLLDDGKFSEAAEYLEDATRLRPGVAGLLRELAEAYLGSGQPRRALDLTSSRSSAEDCYLVAQAQVALGQLPEALEAAQNAVQLAPHDARLLLFLGRLFQRTGRQSDALQLFARAQNAAPEWSDVYYAQAVSLYFDQRYADAARTLDRALTLKPQSARYLFLYGVSLFQEGANQKAEAYLRRAIALDTKSARYQYHLGSLLLRENRLTESVSAFEKAIELDPRYGFPHYQLGKLYAQRHSWNDAARELQQAIRLQPDIAQAHYQLGRVYQATGQTAKAQAAFAEFHSIKSSQDPESGRTEISAEAAVDDAAGVTKTK